MEQAAAGKVNDLSNTSVKPATKTAGKSRITRHNKFGYIFLAPFMIVFVIFQLIPLISTIYYSFFENYMSEIMANGMDPEEGWEIMVEEINDTLADQ